VGKYWEFQRFIVATTTHPGKTGSPHSNSSGIKEDASMRFVVVVFRHRENRAVKLNIVLNDTTTETELTRNAL